MVVHTVYPMAGYQSHTVRLVIESCVVLPSLYYFQVVAYCICHIKQNRAFCLYHCTGHRDHTITTALSETCYCTDPLTVSLATLEVIVPIML